MLKISEIRGKYLKNRFLPRFFLLIFCTLYVQNVLGKYPNLLTRFSGHVDQAYEAAGYKRGMNGIKNCSVNFRIYWDGSCQDQLFDGSYKYSNSNSWVQTAHAEPFITKWNGSSFANVISFYSTTYNNAQTANYSKATPCLQADLFGDWREELVMWNKADSSEQMIFYTSTPTSYAVPTLMHDYVYRMGIAWQNTACNQPPHLGYYLPDYVNGKIGTGIQAISNHTAVGRIQYYNLSGRPVSRQQRGIVIVRETQPDGRVVTRKNIW